MIIKLLNSPKSAISSINYNQNKVDLGLGGIIALNNIKDESSYSIEKALLEREDNPNISLRTRTLGFHAVISPGPGEEMDDKKAAALAKAYMDHIGYREQPWVVYKHTDIERVHYHIVSSKALKDGTILHNSFTGLKTKAFIKEYGKVFGFVLGKNPARGDEKTKYIERFNYAKSNITGQFRHFYKKALGYKYGNMEDFITIMDAFNIKTEIRSDNSLGFIGLDDDKKKQGKYITQLSLMNKDMFRQVMESCTEEKATGDEVESCREAVESCLESTRSEQEFIRELRKMKIDVYLKKKGNRYKAMRFVDHINRTVLTLDDFGGSLDLKQVNLLAAAWKEPERPSIEARSYTTSETQDLLDKMIEKIKIFR